MKLTRINYKITVFRIFLYNKKCLITSKLSHLILQIARLSTKKHLLCHHKICAHKWICPDVSNFILRVIAAIRIDTGLGYGFSLHSHFGVRQFCGKVGTCGIADTVIASPHGCAVDTVVMSQPRETVIFLVGRADCYTICGSLIIQPVIVCLSVLKSMATVTMGSL